MVYRRTEDDLRRAAEIQFQALKISCREFDAGFISEAARLANAVFILVGKGMRNHTSILKSADELEDRTFRSTIEESDFKGSALFYAVLTKEAEDRWSVCLKHAGKAALENGRDLTFDKWWDEKVIQNSKSCLSRAEIVRILRDKNGGAHFDPVVEDPLLASAIQGDLGSFYYSSDDGTSVPVEGGLEYSMRQIVEEFWFSMK
jgi:hypothetical protein